MPAFSSALCTYGFVRGLHGAILVKEKPWTENNEKEVKRVEKIVATALKKAA